LTALAFGLPNGLSFPAVTSRATSSVELSHLRGNEPGWQIH
jgi:hypothetical protein